MNAKLTKIACVFSILATLVSCSPVDDSALERSPIDGSVKKTIVVQNASDTSVTVITPIVENAESYRIVIKAIDEKLTPPAPVSVDANSYTAAGFSTTITNLIPGAEYSFALEATNSATDDWVDVTDEESGKHTMAMATTAPDKTPEVSLKYENSEIVLSVRAENGYAYKGTISSESGISSQNEEGWHYFYDAGENGTLELARTAATGENASYYYSIEVAYYTDTTVSQNSTGTATTATFNLTTNSNGSFGINGNIPEGTEKLELYDQTKQEVVTSVDYTNQTTLTLDDSVESLRTMSLVLRAVVSDDTVIASSLPLSYTSPIIITKEEPSQQYFRAFATLDESAQAIYDFFYQIGNGDEQMLEYEDGAFVISGLESKTSYENVKLRAKDSSGRVVSEVVTNIDTTSFAGIYSWTCEVDTSDMSGNYQDTNFIVNVTDAPEGSDFKYYVRTYSGDDWVRQYPTTEGLRIAPLIDTSISNETNPGTTDYPKDNVEAVLNGSYEVDDFVKAYVWNNTKWNSSWTNSSMNPTSFSIKDSVIEKDKVTAYVDSTTNIMGAITVTTTTEFEFIDRGNGTCYMRFYNEITSGSGNLGSLGVTFGNNALRKNPDPDPLLPGDDGQYTFYLEGTV